MAHISIDCTRDEDFILTNKKNTNKVDKKNNNLSNHPKYFTWCKCHIYLSNNNIYPDKCFMQCSLKPTETNKEIKKELPIEPKNELTKERELQIAPKNELTKERELQIAPKNELTKETPPETNKETNKEKIKNELKKEKRKKIHYIYRTYVILNINKRPTKKQKINYILK